jgi:organic hydroperoxide reductase OsmC/OhrA
MSAREHTYTLDITWTGNDGRGTADYRAYRRDHRIEAKGKPPIEGSSDPAFRGDPTRYNPEELFVAALSTCHMLWYLHLCASAGIVVTAYGDRPIGTMVIEANGLGRFTEVILRPRVVVDSAHSLERAIALHSGAHEKCFVANSVRCLVICEPEVIVGDG